MSKIFSINRTSSLFIATILLTAIFPSFIIGKAQAQIEDFGYDDNNYKSELSKDYGYDKQYYPTFKDPPADIVVPRDFDRIQDAINAAEEDDVIKVLPGNYLEQLTISKSLTILGSGAISTIIESPSIIELELNVLGDPYIVEINNGAEVSMKGFTIQGPEGTECDSLTGVSVLDNGIIDLKYSIINGCTLNPVYFLFSILINNKYLL